MDISAFQPAMIEDIKPLIPDPTASASYPPGHRHSASSVSAGHKVRRRNRLITSCLECRRRKLKCDKSHPCSNCTKFVRDCVFLAPALDPAAQLKLNEIKEKMGTLERTLEDDIARRGRKSSSASGHEPMLGQERSSDDEDAGPDDERDLEPTPLAVTDAAYHEDADDDTNDLGVLVGKMRLTERIGGFVRPKFSQEIDFVLRERTNFTGQSDSAEPPVHIKREADMMPMSMDFIAPTSSFLFAPAPQGSSVLMYLPSKSVADRLLDQYWTAVHPIARVVHRPSFERQWEEFWDQIQNGQESAASMQALVLAALLSATISMTEQAVTVNYAVAKQELAQNFQQGCEAALARANFLRTSKLQTLQALVMYLIPLCRRDVTRAHSALTGTAIRLAECMGLHRDGTHYGLSAVETHVRRMLWYQLCFLDIRTCESTGPRPQIRRDDFDTRMPLNVNDADLELPDPPKEDSVYWTDMTFTRIRFEVNEMHRFTWMERPRLAKKKTTLTAALGRVQNWVSAMDKKFLPMLDQTRDLCRMALLTYRLLSLRLHVMFLHQYSSNHARAMPERLRKILLTSGMQQVECAMIIETDPSMKTWSWYIGALIQYHTALLLLSELYATGVRYQEDRIWKVIDFVFECPSHMTRKEKAKSILSDIIQKTEIYNALRRVRAPSDIEAAMAPNSESQAIRDHVMQPIKNSYSAAAYSQADTSKPGIGKLQAQMPYQAWRSDVAEHVQYAPVDTNPYAIAAAHTVSPSSEGTCDMARMAGAQAHGTSPNENMLDVDWNEWDRMFPPDVNLSDFGNLPNFQFSTSFPVNGHAHVGSARPMA